MVECLHHERPELAGEHGDAHGCVLQVTGDVHAQHGHQAAHARIGDPALDLHLDDPLHQARELRALVAWGARGAAVM